MRKNTTLVIALCATLVANLATAAPGLDESEFKKLHAQLAPPSDEAWRGLPWQDSVLQAAALAATQKKPVYMLVRSGNPLGCV
jgi:hypothetical protein